LYAVLLDKFRTTQVGELYYYTRPLLAKNKQLCCYSLLFVQLLCQELSPHLKPADHGAVYVPADKKVHMTVWYLSNQETFRQIANLFGMAHRSTAHDCVIQVCQAIVQYLSTKYIKWPSDAEQQEIASAFEASSGFPGIIGCIDGTHIPVKPPAGDRDSYINRKGYPSINVMAVCDHRMLFTAVFADRAGSVHDARVLRVSPLGQKLESSDIGQPDFHILGDSAYPLLPQLLVPYRDNGHLTQTQHKYNTVHAAARAIIERTFARLKGKLRRLRGIDCTRVTNSLLIIDAAFALHNFMIVNDNQEYDAAADDIIQEDSDNQIGQTSNSAAVTRQIAAAKRDRISLLF
jgi:DDE superfamily endonuclease